MADAPPPIDMEADALADLAAYAEAQKTTGLLLIQDRRVLLERNWPVPASDGAFNTLFIHGVAADGAVLEDVASQQKSFIAVLIAVAADQGLLDVDRPVSDYVGKGWSKAAAADEAAISILHLMQMTSGLTEGFEREAEPGTKFFYNTPAYAVLKPALEAASGRSLDEITRAWLTESLGMADTAWRARPAQIAQSSGNATGLVTTPRDVARLGQMVLDGGLASDGRRVVSEAQLALLFEPTPINPAYGRLWWLNSGGHAVSAHGVRTDGPLVPNAPKDLVLALGAQGRQLGVLPSRQLICVRLGQQPPDADFAARFWALIAKAAV